MGINKNPLQSFLETLFEDLSLLFRNPILFFDTYFFSAPGYNLYNTIVYTLLGILGILIVGKIIVLLNHKGSERWGKDNFIPIRMDNQFFISVLPYIFIGSSLRALQDVAKQGKILPQYEIFGDRLFVTPGVYIVTILLTIVFGVISIFISQEYLQEHKHFSNWRKIFVLLGIIIEFLLILPFIPLILEDQTNLIGGIIIILGTILFGFLFSYSGSLYSQKFLSENPIRFDEKLTVITQMYDAIGTVISIEFFAYQEKSYLPSILFQSPIGSWSFLIVKLIFVLFFLWAVRGFENRNLEKWLLWVVFLLGLATGTRDFLRLITKT